MLSPGQFNPQALPPAVGRPPAVPAGGATAWTPSPPANRVVPPSPAAPRPVVRAQSPEEPKAFTRPAPLSMPSPEELGVSAGRRSAADADWTLARRRLNELGASCFQLEKLPGGGYRFVCLLPGSQSNRNHRVESEAASEAEAVRLALARAEQVIRK